MTPAPQQLFLISNSGTFDYESIVGHICYVRWPRVKLVTDNINLVSGPMAVMGHGPSVFSAIS